jgi:hypothetical protein
MKAREKKRRLGRLKKIFLKVLKELSRDFLFISIIFSSSHR